MRGLHIGARLKLSLDRLAKHAGRGFKKLTAPLLDLVRLLIELLRPAVSLFLHLDEKRASVSWSDDQGEAVRKYSVA